MHCRQHTHTRKYGQQLHTRTHKHTSTQARQLKRVLYLRQRRVYPVCGWIRVLVWVRREVGTRANRLGSIRRTTGIGWAPELRGLSYGGLGLSRNGTRHRAQGTRHRTPVRARAFQRVWIYAGHGQGVNWGPNEESSCWTVGPLDGGLEG